MRGIGSRRGTAENSSPRGGGSSIATSEYSSLRRPPEPWNCEGFSLILSVQDRFLLVQTGTIIQGHLWVGARSRLAAQKGTFDAQETRPAKLCRKKIGPAGHIFLPEPNVRGRAGNDHSHPLPSQSSGRGARLRGPALRVRARAAAGSTHTPVSVRHFAAIFSCNRFRNSRRISICFTNFLHFHHFQNFWFYYLLSFSQIPEGFFPWF